ncbi:hypothetical protein [Clostridium botulinum]|uniref:hypothetical protein n=1 Tax=Clostridium botulinum TaxID=1491 RepID=UPI001C9AD8DE|nr:hypothetical protein [Clostridium botulinum]MBY6838786.1 hypothetical protein [Clostridium botulinum]
MKKVLNENMIREYIKETGRTRDEIIKGYGIFTSDYMNGALHIERYDDINLYESDEQASNQAEKDGIKLIKDLPISENDRDFGYFIDSKENREMIGEYLYKERNIDWNDYSFKYATEYQLY